MQGDYLYGVVQVPTATSAWAGILTFFRLDLADASGKSLSINTHSEAAYSTVLAIKADEANALDLHVIF